MINAIIVTSSATLDKTACYLTKGLTETLSSPREKNHGGEIHEENIRPVDKVLLGQYQTGPTRSQKTKQDTKTTSIPSLLHLEPSEPHLWLKDSGVSKEPCNQAVFGS